MMMNISITNSELKKFKNLFDEPQEVYRNLVCSLHDAAYIADARGNLIFVNPSLLRLLGYKKKEEVLGKNIAKKFYVNTKDRKEFLQEIKTKGFVSEYEIQTKRKDGSKIVVAATSSYIRNKEGNIVGVQGTFHDITEKKKLEEELILEKSKLEQILCFHENIASFRELEKLFDFIVEKTPKILEAEKCSLMLFDKDANELYIKAARGLSENIMKQERIELGNQIAGVVAQQNETVLVTDIEHDERFQRKNRSTYLRKSFIAAPIKLDSKLIGVINVTDKSCDRDEAIFTNIDLKIMESLVRVIAVAIENVRFYKELNHLTTIDPLTQLYNLVQFKKLLHLEIKRADRFSEPLCLMMIDVDDLKSYNDAFGHLEGSELLKKISVILKENLRDIDIACRFGGDEFSVILPETDVQGAEIAAKKIISEVERFPFKRKVSVSIGLAKRENKMDGNDLMRNADSALYEAKDKGKNRVCTFA